MKVGNRVNHSKLGTGVVLEFRKHGGVMVDFSDAKGVLVRVCHVSSLEVIDE
tara:strand:- start:1087 stop:1242 length:156 start_codon:yes stop_codon:yes gene_type:complete